MSFCFYLEIDRNCEIYDVKCPYYPRCEKCKDYEYFLKKERGVMND